MKHDMRYQNNITVAACISVDGLVHYEMFDKYLNSEMFVIFLHNLK